MPLSSRYNVMINDALRAIPLKTQDDFAKTTAYLEKILPASTYIDPICFDSNLRPAISGIQEFLTDPELYAEAENYMEYDALIRHQIKEYIDKLKQMSTPEKDAYIQEQADCKKRAENNQQDMAEVEKKRKVVNMSHTIRALRRRNKELGRALNYYSHTHNRSSTDLGAKEYISVFINGMAIMFSIDLLNADQTQYDMLRQQKLVCIFFTLTVNILLANSAHFGAIKRAFTHKFLMSSDNRIPSNMPGLPGHESSLEEETMPVIPR